MGTTTEWRKVTLDGFDMYEVSNKGEVRSRKTGHCRKLTLKHNRRTGYTYVILYNNGKSITRSVHRLVALAFIPNPDNLPTVNHIDEDKTNNNVENLEWASHRDNNIYSKHKRYKAIELYTVDGELLATFESERAAANVLGVGKSNVSRALNGGVTCGGFVIRYKKEVA